MAKQRVTITVDEELVRAALAGVELGQAESLSGWVTGAMAERHAHNQRLAALGDLIADFEVVNGPITAQELAIQAQQDRDVAGQLRGQTGRVQ